MELLFREDFLIDGEFELFASNCIFGNEIGAFKKYY